MAQITSTAIAELDQLSTRQRRVDEERKTRSDAINRALLDAELEAIDHKVEISRLRGELFATRLAALCSFAAVGYCVAKLFGGA